MWWLFRYFFLCIQVSFRLWVHSSIYWIRLWVFFYMLRACAHVWEKAVWDQTCPLHCYTNTKRTNSKWHLNWSRWKALWTGSKGWYFHAGVKTNPPPSPTLSPLSFSCTFGPNVSAFLAPLLRLCKALPVRAPGAPIWVITIGSEAAGLI